jgi:phosphate transport system substrate-binding protein
LTLKAATPTDQPAITARTRFSYKEKPYMQLRGSKQAIAAGGAAIAVLAMAACSSSSSSSTSTPAASTPASSAAASSPASSAAAAGSGTLNGAGSSFQNTFQLAAISAFKSVNPAVTVNYNSVGSGTGRSDLYSNTVLFAGSDSPIPASEQSKVPAGKTVLYFPVFIGPITLSYNLSGISNLKLTPDVIAGIFMGQIKTWNDPKITAINPGVSLPSTAITTAVRSDSSGTTQNFSLYLQKAAPSIWTLGSASTVKWPSTAHAGAQNTGVASIIKSTPGAIGYVDYTDAKASGLSYASVKNTAGQFVAPSPSGASADAAGATIKPDLTFAAADAGTSADSYPISYQSWDLVYAQQSNANDVAMLKSYLGYLLGAGQQLLPTLFYAPLPAALDQKAIAQLSQITAAS